MSIVHTRADVHAFVDAMPLLVSRLRDLSIDRTGVIDPTTGDRRGGLVVTAGVHDRPGTRYRLVTQRPTVDIGDIGDAAVPAPAPVPAPTTVTTEIELQANDRRNLIVVAQVIDPSHHELTLTMHDPDRLGTIEVHSARRFTNGWPVGGPMQIDGTADLAQIRAADDTSSAAAMRLRHRRLAGSATLTAAEADDNSIRFTIHANVHGRGLFRPIVAIGSLVFAGKLRRAVAKTTDEAMVEWRKKRAIAGEFHATTIADSLLADWLSLVVPAVVTDSSGPMPR